MGKKMYYILKIMQSVKGKSITSKEVVEQLKEYGIDVDVKTVHSCIHQINDFFWEWLGQNMITIQRKSGLMITHEFFTDGELQFILDSIAYHEDLHYEDKQVLKDHLLLLSSAHQQSRLLPFLPPQKEINFSLFLNLSTIMKAIENKNTLSFQYINYAVKYNHLQEIPSQNGNHKEEYSISPYQIVSNNNHYYLIGYNQKYQNQLTTYRIDRMRIIKTTRQSFIEIREQFDMSDEIKKTTNMYIASSRDTLQIECQQKILREVASRFGENLKAKKLYQDHYLVTIDDIPISEGLIGWLMMLQDRIKVIAPLSLQRKMKEQIRKMTELYNG